MNLVSRLALLIIVLSILSRTVRADEPADALLKEVAEKVNAALPLTVEYRTTYRQGNTVQSEWTRLIRKPGGVVSMQISSAERDGPPFDAMRLLTVNRLEPLFPRVLYIIAPPAPDQRPNAPNGFATRLLPPETIGGQTFRVIEVVNPFTAGSEKRTVPRIVARYYVGEDHTFRRVVFEVKHHARQIANPTPTDMETLTVEVEVEKLRKALLPPERKPAGIPEREILLPKSEIRDGNASFVTATALSLDGKWLATGHYNTQVKLRDPATSEEKRTLEGHLSAIKRLAFSADSAVLASQSQDNTLALWETATGELIRTFPSLTEVRAFALAPDGKRLAMHLPDQNVIVRDSATGATLATLKLPVVSQLHFAPDGKTLLTVEENGLVKLWDIATWKERAILHALRDPAQEVTAAAISPDSKTLALGGWSGGLEVYDAVSGKQIQSLPGTLGPITALAFSPSSTWLAVADRDPQSDLNTVLNGVALWSTAEWKREYTLAVETGNGSEQLVFSPTEKEIATFARPRGVVLPYTGIKIWSLAPKAMRPTFLGQ